MSIQIIESIDKNKLYCAGSFTKLVTTYVSLCLLSEKYALETLLDNDDFLDTLCVNQEAREFLALFQKLIGGKFSIHDLCSYYSGLPYTFDLSEKELVEVESGKPFKHHHIPDEETFLYRCHHKITPVYANKCKFHYSEISIIFLAYFLEKVYQVTMEDLYQKWVIDQFNLKFSYFSRKRNADVYCQDLSNEYDYPSIAITDHGYFCYSNGFYTTLSDMKILLENLLKNPVFQVMTDIKHARAASNRLLNGLAVELRLVGDDIIYGYEGLSFSGCNIWAYSTKKKEGFLTFSNSEEEAYTIYNRWGYTTFDTVPPHTQQLYADFIKHYHENAEKKAIPVIYQGHYHRVKINEKSLDMIFSVGENFIVIRNPEKIKYDVVYANKAYRIKCKDGIHGGKIGFYTADSGNHYMMYDGTLYKKI